VPRNSEQAARVLARVGEIRAQVHVLLGNHDGPHPEYRRSLRELRRWEASGVFASIQLADCHWLAGRKVMISHFPYAGDHTGTDRYADWRPRNTGRVLLHAHTHDYEQITRPAVAGGTGLALRQVNIGLEAWGLRPAPRHVLEKLIAEEFGAGEG
jgi:calcineurin-like phosphoesterase family protein